MKLPPASDEIEVSVFGPGIGESILVHIGQNDWISIDSSKFLGDAWALHYIKQLGLLPEECIRLIVATHWHTDHVDGISRVVDSCPNAVFACSAALQKVEFQQILARYGDDAGDKLPAPLFEIRSIFDKYRERIVIDQAYPAPNLAKHGQLLYSRRSGETRDVEIWALSPSNADVLLAAQEFASLFYPLDRYANGISPMKPNKASIVLYICIGSEIILLGGDLEQTGNPQSGWNAVVASPIRTSKAHAFKVPHHGSAGAFSQKVWDDAIVSESIAVITPYLRSALPRAAELERLKRVGGRVYATALPKPCELTRTPDVQKAMNMNGKRNVEAFELPTDESLVRLRKRPDQPWTVQLFGSAVEI